MTLFPAERAGDVGLADVDVDENENGVRHLFDVIKHHLTGRPTHPVDVHQILTHYQEMDLGYQPLV